MDDGNGVPGSARGLRLAEEAAVASLHQGTAAPDGPAGAVTQVIAGVAPVGFDAGLPEERLRDLTMGRTGTPTVQRLQDERQALSTRLGWEMLLEQASRSMEIVQAAERAQVRAQAPLPHQRLGHQVRRTKDVGAGHCKLEAAPSILDQDMVEGVRCLQDERPAGRPGETQTLRRGPCRARKSRQAKDMGAVRRAPDHGRRPRVSAGRLGERARPTAQGPQVGRAA